jgi:hypothetical protein
MKSLNRLISGLYADACRLSIEAKPDHRDLKTIAGRIKKEGRSFVTITLPSFSKALLSAIEKGYWEQSQFSAFGRKSGSCLPNLCWGFTSRLFDSKSGRILDSYPVHVLDGLLQFLRFFKRVKEQCNPKRTQRAYLQYAKVDDEVKPLRKINTLDAVRLRKVFDTLFADLACRVESKLIEGTLIPRHGSGAVAEKLDANARYSANWYNRLDGSFPPELFISPNLGADNSLDGRSYVEVGAESPARVTSVPKTAKTPRIIAIEPACIQYTQQSIMMAIYDELDRARYKSVFNIRDQSANQKEVMISSVTRSMATLDLSEASDRVGAGLVSYLFKSFPTLRRALFSCRSSKVSLPQGVKTLKKFASMGSAVCFPIEAIVFATIVTLGMLTADRLPLTRYNIRRYFYRVKVYGDDLIVPVDHASSVSLALEFFGLKVNPDKSFARSEFRESCGEDWCRGIRVTSVYLNHWIPEKPDNVEAVVSSAHLISRLWASGMWATASYLESRCRSVLGRLPTVLPTSPCLGVVIPWRGYDAFRTHRTLHRPEVYGFRIKPKTVSSPIDGYNALLKSFLPKREKGFDPTMHLSAPGSLKSLETVAKPHDFELYRAWSVPY